ncbi:type II toxin-antitoxin system VapC family toxin [Methylosinus sp. Sm6]|uniref:type II toxin-antitoxin system VapC family toxin n=1 Tax=Methylosinus sp. Sm6 TaxID=2866948 RepID=UPI001C9A1F57|nr:type II toxin-antitoxin system VapC family toxin [Methylosinus sp. Sm6]MBY6241615.1 type II toxin-antitoxin system VapC family toxin [Methylosinus sp. Sm6]
MTIKGYLDANIFILAFERQGPVSDCARSVFDLVNERGAVAVISELLVAELLVHPIRKGDDRLAAVYSELLGSPTGFETRPIDRQVLVEAARQRAIRGKTKLPDAIHVATARLHACRAFVTADRKLEVAMDLESIDLGPHTVEAIRALA